MRKKIIFFITALILLNSCVHRLKEDNPLAMPPIFRDEYEENLKKPVKIKKK
jgi:hypothetical protein